MKKIHDILKARKKNLHATHVKKQSPTDFYNPIFARPLLAKREQLSALSAALSAQSKINTAKPKPPAQKPETHPTNVNVFAGFHNPSSALRGLPGRFFSTRQAKAQTSDQGSTSIGEVSKKEVDQLDKERIARLRELLNGVINHPGSLTPTMFWILFMKIAPHFSMTTAGCVRVSALFWLMLSYIKAKNKTKKRKLKEQLVVAAEWLEKDEESAIRPRRR